MNALIIISVLFSICLLLLRSVKSLEPQFHRDRLLARTWPPTLNCFSTSINGKDGEKNKQSREAKKGKKETKSTHKSQADTKHIAGATVIPPSMRLYHTFFTCLYYFLSRYSLLSYFLPTHPHPSPLSLSLSLTHRLLH